MHRRNFFKNSTIAGVGLVCAPSLSHILESSEIKYHNFIVKPPVKPQIMAPNGAVYIPAKVYNTWQQWKYFNLEEIERDFGYAESIGLNSLRIWLSYEYWLENPRKHEDYLNLMLNVAEKKGLKILIALFDSVGVENNAMTREDKNPKTAVGIQSPSSEICMDNERWNEPAKFVHRFMDLFANDRRLLAIEIMNEPGFVNNRIALCRFLFKIAKEKQGLIPLTIGSLQDMQNWGNFMDLGIDILQVHLNFPTNLEEFNKQLIMANQVGELLGRPLWVTEWQRIRQGGSGLNRNKIPEEDLGPDLASLASSIRKAGIGNYFWSLMLKLAYLPHQRELGAYNGLFHEDGTVYSLVDARAVSQNPKFMAKERMESPGISGK